MLSRQKALEVVCLQKEATLEFHQELSNLSRLYAPYGGISYPIIPVISMRQEYLVPRFQVSRKVD